MTRTLAITEVLVRFFPYVGGVENTAYELSRRLVRRGHRLRVVCSAEAPATPSQVEGIAVHRLPWIGKLGNANLCPALWRAARAAPADVFHSHLPTALYPDAAAAAARAQGVPFVLSYNTDNIVPGPLGMLGHVYHRLLLERTLRKTTRIVIPNPEYAGYSRYLRNHRQRIVVIPWGVDLERFAPAPAPPPPPPLVVGFLSLLDRFHRYKGLEELLRGAAAAVGQGVDLRLRIGGAGEELPFYRRLAGELGLGERVEWLGFVADAALGDFFASLHLFALPSRNLRQEGFGLVALEAMAAGRTVLTTPIAAVAADLVAHDAGVVVPVESPAAISAALVAAGTGRLPLAELGERSRRLAETRYGWEAVTDRYEELFRELVEQGTAGGTDRSGRR